MSNTTASSFAELEGMTRARMLRAYGKELKYECLRMLRTPAFVIPTLIFPALFYLLIGFIFGAFGGTQIRSRGLSLALRSRRSSESGRN